MTIFFGGLGFTHSTDKSHKVSLESVPFSLYDDESIRSNCKSYIDKYNIQATSNAVMSTKAAKLTEVLTVQLSVSTTVPPRLS
ncbi:hypothetical protein J6590_008446 [Homalodisca vitripennis]|nr:hypothetical protein J6590_008446 [Homalodisca vitripennis]